MAIPTTSEVFAASAEARLAPRRSVASNRRIDIELVLGFVGERVGRII
jgi:hypothetical protein